MQRNVFTLIPSNNVIGKSLISQEQTSRMLSNNISSFGSSTEVTPPPDDSLTNLSWLHDINILKRSIPTINSSTNSIGNNEKSKETTVYPNDIDDSNDLNIHNDEHWRMYRSNPHAKPIYSYSQLILLAMKQSGHEKMTLQMIYEWVAENFPYFKKMEPTWQNSIRHNLSLNKCFVKVARTKKETSGKGGFWKLSPDYLRQENHLNSSTNKRFRPSKRSSTHLQALIKNSLRSSSIKCEPSSLHCQTVRMPSSLLSPISSPDAFPSSHFSHPNEFSSILTPSPSSSPSSMTKQNLLPTKLDETEMLLLEAATFDWDAYLYETPTDLDVQPLLTSKSEQDLFNEFNAALTDLTSSAGGDVNAFEGFDYPIRSSTFQTLFEEDEQQQQPVPQASLAIKGRGIKRPSWWLTNDAVSSTRLPSLETAFDLKLSK